MNTTPVRVLLVDADTASSRRLRRMLSGESALAIRLAHVQDVRGAVRRVRKRTYDVVLIHLLRCGMPGLPGTALIQGEATGVPLIVLAPAREEGLALKALQQGAADYLITDQLYGTVVARTILHAIERRRAAEYRGVAERALRTSEAKYRALFEQSRDAILIMDPQGTIIAANNATTRLLQYSPAEVEGKPLAMLAAEPADQVVVGEELRLKAPAPELETRLRRKDGEVLWCLLSVAHLTDESGVVTGCQAILHDITERKRAEERLLHEAFHDELTGLPNRALFAERLEMAMQRMRRRPERRFAVLYLDLDRFKVVNDSLGHAVGDALLVHVGRVLASCVRGEETVARMGGDEFAILLDIDDEEEALHAARRIQARLGQSYVIAGKRLFTSASVGIAFPETPEQPPADVLRNADIAMYRAKGAGPARHEVFAATMHTRAVDLLELETDLRLALTRSEFVLHYQPILSLQGHRIVGLEALLRWAHPARGLLLPQEFLPLAEDTGTIVPIGWWVLREACREARLLMELCPADAQPFISINISGQQLLAPDLVEQVAAVLDETDVPPAKLQLEITETSLIGNAAAAGDTLERLRATGVQVCIDDFGIGYSSLGYLHTLPVDGLKIDRSFIDRIRSSTDGAELVATIIKLARRLGLQTVAEGVETEEQLEQLRRLGPAYVQGFLFSVPVDALRARALVASSVGSSER
jgi:diguanylate cyclase (GGDEF)-like protein/PAS domain S-box-containing protein